MTIYAMYSQNGNRAGFWVQHRGWGNTCAIVVTVGGVDMGPLPGKPPAHDQAEVVVCQHDVRSGRLLNVNLQLVNPADKNFSFIAEPAWSRGKQPVSVPLAPYQEPREHARAEEAT